jgi:hypothetical protein
VEIGFGHSQFVPELWQVCRRPWFDKGTHISELG